MKIMYLNAEHKKINIDGIEDYQKKIGKTTFLRKDYKSKNQQTLLSSDNVAVREILKVYDGFQIDEFDKRGDKIRAIKVFLPKHDVNVKEPIDKYFNYYETYFPNGEIHSKSVKSWLGFDINKRYNYSEIGALLAVVDTDEGYSFTYKNIFRFCKAHSISFETKSIPININKIVSPVGRKTWIITYANENLHKMEIYILDGKNGDIIKHYFEPWPGFVHLD